MAAIPERVHLIENDFWQVGILPTTGASTAFGRIRHGSEWIDFMRPTPEAQYGAAHDCASYLLIPWSNRIRDGRFRFRGKDHQLKVNFGDGTAIHGTAKDYPWTVDFADAKRIVCSFRSADAKDVNFLFQFSTTVEFRVDGRTFDTTVSIKNEDREPMPAGFGHHPYFRRALVDAADTVELEIPCTKYFELSRCLPSGPPVPVVPRVDFRLLRPLGSELVDDCLTSRIARRPILFHYTGSRRRVALHFDDVFQNVVLYLPRDSDTFAVEPVTNANDGFNLFDRGIEGSGVFVLGPAEERRGTFSLSVDG